MGKRSDFARKERDFYPTPYPAVLPLLPHLKERTRFAEPCAGAGALVAHLQSFGHRCLHASDIEPQLPHIYQEDALRLAPPFGVEIDCFITNPPWSRHILHPMIEHLSSLVPTWLLLDADWMHTKQAATYLQVCHKIVSVGRVKWIEDSPHTGKDNCAWYLFDMKWAPEATLFYGRKVEA